MSSILSFKNIFALNLMQSRKLAMHLTKLINVTKKARLKTIPKTYYHKKAFKYYQLITNYNLLM